jgi:hypothetical protein
MEIYDRLKYMAKGSERGWLASCQPLKLRSATTYNKALTLFVGKHNCKWINSLLIANRL